MKGTDATRSEIQRLLRATPFKPFVIILASGDRALIEHPENVAYDAQVGGRNRFHVVTGRLTLVGTLDAVTGLVFADDAAAGAAA